MGQGSPSPVLKVNHTLTFPNSSLGVLTNPNKYRIQDLHGETTGYLPTEIIDWFIDYINFSLALLREG